MAMPLPHKPCRRVPLQQSSTKPKYAPGMMNALFCTDAKMLSNNWFLRTEHIWLFPFGPHRFQWQDYNQRTDGSSIIRKIQASFYPGQLNNEIGVPLTILSAPVNTEMMVIEMGANHQGEIMALCEIAKPGMAMITNIGLAHLEGFGGTWRRKKSKSEMYRYLDTHGAKYFWILPMRYWFRFKNTSSAILYNANDYHTRTRRVS